MLHLIRLLQRAAILALGAFAVWLIVFVVFRFAHQKLPLIVAFGATYLAAAYVILPYAVRMGLNRHYMDGRDKPGHDGKVRVRLRSRIAAVRIIGEDQTAPASWPGLSRPSTPFHFMQDPHKGLAIRDLSPR